MLCDWFGLWCATHHAAQGAPEIDGGALPMLVTVAVMGLLAMKGQRR